MHRTAAESTLSSLSPFPHVKLIHYSERRRGEERASWQTRLEPFEEAQILAPTNGVEAAIFSLSLSFKTSAVRETATATTGLFLESPQSRYSSIGRFSTPPLFFLRSSLEPKGVWGLFFRGGGVLYTGLESLNVLTERLVFSKHSI